MAATQVTRDQTVALATAPGQRLRADAAAAWDAAVRAYGSTVLLTDSYRPYDKQVQIFDSELYPDTGRYVRGDHRGRAGYTSDLRGPYRGSYWTRRAGTAAAAVPGTSNHGGGLAVDVKTKRSASDPAHPAAVVFAGFSDADRLRFLEVARPYGWADDEGRSVNEPWHLTYYPARDTHPTQEDDMFTDADRAMLQAAHQRDREDRDKMKAALQEIQQAARALTAAATDLRDAAARDREDRDKMKAALQRIEASALVRKA